MLTTTARALRRSSVTLALATAATLAACAQKPRTRPAPDPDDDRVEVGYGSQSKAQNATAISSVDAGEHTVSTWEQLLSGRVPGLEVVNGPTGMTLRIRGASTLMSGSDPLIILDGTPLSGTANLFAAVSPQDVKRIEVLKDAGSTAIYGSRGANGVILVTTKKR